MLQRSSFASFVVFASLALAGAAFTGACSQQSEGEPCNPNADDCASNLTCTQVAVSNDGYRCCPSSNPTTPVCSQNNTGVNNSNPPPSSDASTTPTDGEAGSTSPDSSAAETSSSTEAGRDAPGDAPSTGNDGGDASSIEASPDASSGDAGDGAAD
jgi:hypothetical protein